MIIATPGRLVDHLRRRTVQLSKVAVLVLDEADRMLDMGFAPQLTQILNQVPTQRQTLFFTATWASELDQLSKKYLRDPVKITVGEVSRAAPQITQSVVMTTANKKNEALLDELNRRSGSVLVFTRTKSRTDRVARYLTEYGVEVNRLHGGRTQGQRNSALAAFRSGKARVLIATDIAARGIDIAKIGHVINYDLPQSSEDYIHRIGRTGRAGETGQAISLLTPEDRQQWKEISKLLVRSGSQVPALANEVARTDESHVNPRKRSKVSTRFSQRRKEGRSWGERTKQRKLSGTVSV
jgi:ATP-dependent RNA helicase RhlE